MEKSFCLRMNLKQAPYSTADNKLSYSIKAEMGHLPLCMKMPDVMSCRI